MRKLKYLVACSADRFIARNDGDLSDFAFDGEHVADLLEAFPETIPQHLREALGVDAENQAFDTVLMGRHTYEVGVKLGFTNPYPHLQQYVFSRSMNESPDPEVALVSDDAIECVQELKTRPGKDIWLCGGAELASTLHSEIDELILKVNPFLMGSGKSIFAQELAKIDLNLISHRVYPNGFMLLHYGLK